MHIRCKQVQSMLDLWPCEAGNPRCSSMICERVFYQSSVQSSTPRIAVAWVAGPLAQHNYHHPRFGLDSSWGSGLKSESRGHYSSSCQSRKPRRYAFKRAKFHRLFGDRRPKKKLSGRKNTSWKIGGWSSKIFPCARQMMLF